MTNQEVKLKNNTLVFPKHFKGFKVNPAFINNQNFISFQQVRIIPKNQQYIIELIYNIKILDVKSSDNGKYLSIDIGVDNLAAMTNNIGLQPVIINGKGLKSINTIINSYRIIVK